jgi:hypothetical protein
MLAMQIAVRDGTVDLDRVIQSHSDKLPERADQQKGNKLEESEQDIIKEASTAIRLIEAEGSAIAFAEVFKQVRSDMVRVAERLRKTDAGALTVRIENDIIDTLKEMIEALKKARQENQDKKPKDPKQGQQGRPQDQKLIDMLAELKMIRSMQVRVNSRTETYHQVYKGQEQAPAPATAQDAKQKEQYEQLQKELKELADRQANIYKITNDIYRGKNKGQ